MKKNFMFKFLISIFFVLVICFKAYSASPTFVSLSPALTEIMFAIGAQDMLKGVSTACTYPKEAQKKEKIGDNFYINEEKILTIKPNYILAFDSSSFALNKYKRFNITPLCLQNQDINSIYNNILTLGKMTGKTNNAQNVVNYTKQKIAEANTHHNKKILYLLQTSPLISIGKKSFITDIIEKSGNISVTKDLNTFYPTISEEYAINKQPDVIVLSFYSNDKRIKKLFPKAKIVFMNVENNEIINRPSNRIYKSIEFFAGI